MHIVINGVKTTFFQFPYDLQPSLPFETIIGMPPLLDLAAMKAYALGGRAKWKDYVDLYFILKQHHSFDDIAERSKNLFQSFFNDKLFKEQLAYFDDIDYSEEVEFMGDKIPDEEIKNFLIETATEDF